MIGRRVREYGRIGGNSAGANEVDDPPGRSYREPADDWHAVCLYLSTRRDKVQGTTRACETLCTSEVFEFNMALRRQYRTCSFLGSWTLSGKQGADVCRNFH